MSDELLLTCRRFTVVRRRYRSAEGVEHTHESVQHPGAVTIVPMVDDDHVCLIRNFRLAVGRTLLELPAGTLEPGEPPLTTARRELEEETGYRAAEITPLCEFFMSPGILNERMHLFLATRLTPGATDLDEGESIESQEIVAWGDALAMCRDGRIEDAKSLVGLMFYDALRSK